MNVQTNITVHAKSRVIEVQKDFTLHFPYLRLRFIKAYEDKIINAPGLNIASISAQLKYNDDGDAILISALMSVAELETAFYEHFGLHVAVLRKSGNVWLETNFTDSWTLQQQNNMGESIS